jgi:hypothetical protein
MRVRLDYILTALRTLLWLHAEFSAVEKYRDAVVLEITKAASC